MSQLSTMEETPYTTPVTAAAPIVTGFGAIMAAVREALNATPDTLET